MADTIDPFAKILSSAEFALTALLRKAHELYGITSGVYFICDGGYLRWPVLICPFKHSGSATHKGYFSSTLESVRKDVECTFGILKKRWKILEYGICFDTIEVVQRVFTVCCILHNMMLSEMVTEGQPSRLRRGNQMANDGGMWLEGPACGTLDTDTVSGEAKKLKEAFDSRRTLLAHHLKVWREKNK